MRWFLIILVLALSNLSEAKHGKKLPSAVVVGTVYCDTCFQKDFSKDSRFISGATVAVECKDENSRPGFRKEVKTDNRGEFKVTLPFSVSKHVTEIKRCSVKLVSSSQPYCAVASTATSSSLHLKSRKQGMHIFSAGFFTFKPQRQPILCNQKPSIQDSGVFNTKKFSQPAIPPFDPTFPPPLQDPPAPIIPPADPVRIPPVPLLPPLPPLTQLPPLPPLTQLPPLPPLTQLPSLPPLQLPPLPPLPSLPPLPGLPGIPPFPGKPTQTKASKSSKNVQWQDQKRAQTDQFGFPFPPIGLTPPPFFPPVPGLTPPPAPLIPLPPIPGFTPPPAPLIPLPPFPGLTPPSPPPPSFPIPLPPFPSFPFPPSPPPIPGIPPAASSASSKKSSP